MINWRKKFKRPTPDSVWCDECLRWETGSKRFERPAVPMLAKLLELLARVVMWPGMRISFWLNDRAEEIRVRANIKTGEFDAR